MAMRSSAAVVAMVLILVTHRARAMDYGRAALGARQLRGIPWPDHPEFGAFHSAEVPYVFGNLAALNRPRIVADRQLAVAVSSRWAAFVASGSPSGNSLPKWPAYRPGSLEQALVRRACGPRGRRSGGFDNYLVTDLVAGMTRHVSANESVRALLGANTLRVVPRLGRGWLCVSSQDQAVGGTTSDLVELNICVAWILPHYLNRHQASRDS